MNNLTWNLVFPEFSKEQISTKYANFAHYRDSGKRLEIMDIDDLDIEKTCAFLDKAYDFLDHNNPPTIDVLTQI